MLPAVLDRLRAVGYQGGITVVRDRLRHLRPRPKQEAFFTRDYGPGQMLQVDWADFGFALPGCARRVSAFVAALAYSRHLYLEFVLSQAIESFLRCMDRALCLTRFNAALALPRRTTSSIRRSVPGRSFPFAAVDASPLRWHLGASPLPSNGSTICLVFWRLASSRLTGVLPSHSFRPSRPQSLLGSR